MKRDFYVPLIIKMIFLACHTRITRAAETHRTPISVEGLGTQVFRPSVKIRLKAKSPISWKRGSSHCGSRNWLPRLPWREDQRHLRGPKSWRTKNLNSIRSLGDQTTWGTNKKQEAGRGRKLNIHNSILIKLWGVKIQNTHLQGVFFNWCPLKITIFFR